MDERIGVLAGERPPAGGAPREVRIQPSGWRFEAPADLTVLMAAQAAGIGLPSSCRNGTCRSCMCALVSGEVEYGIPWPGISRDEREDGWLLPCVAHARTDLVIEVPDARKLEPAGRPVRAVLTGARR